MEEADDFNFQTESEEVVEVLVPEVKLFGKWTTSDVQVNDISLCDYLPVKDKYSKYLPHSAGRYQVKRFRKATCPIVKRCFEIINLLTDKNPLQILIDAIINSGPREDPTRIGRAGTVRRQSVDVAPLRRVNQAIWLLCHGAREASFRNIKSIAECLSDELINAAKGSSN